MAPGRTSGARAGAILERNLWTQRHWVDGLAEDTQLSGLDCKPWTIGHGLLSGRPQVRVLPGAPAKVVVDVVQGAGRLNAGARPGALLGPQVYLASELPQSLLDESAPLAAQPPSRSMYLGRLPVERSRASSGTCAACALGWPHPTNLAGVSPRSPPTGPWTASAQRSSGSCGEWTVDAHRCSPRERGRWRGCLSSTRARHRRCSRA
jgi:hypothetical protein